MEINDIITAISVKLHHAFGEGYKKHTDDIPQGFKTPAFFIQFLNLEHIQQMGKRWRIVTLFNVQYFPSGGAAEIANMSLKVQHALREITLLNGSIMRSTSNNSEPVDGVGHNFMNFNFYLYEKEVVPFMETLEHYQKTGE